MLWLAIVLFIALAMAVLRGGRLTNLGDIELRYWWLLLVALGLQGATAWLPDTSWAEGLDALRTLGGAGCIADWISS